MSETRERVGVSHEGGERVLFEAIKRQEARGQVNLLNSTMLPRTIHGGTREDFERMGIVWDEGDCDDLFMQATLPEGWSKRATSHSLWSKLVDAQGRERASIFYKAAFYDRDAFMRPTHRFAATYQPVGGWDAGRGGEEEGIVTDAGEIVWRSAPQTDGPDRDYASDRCRALATGWLEEHYPDWQSIHAYW